MGKLILAVVFFAAVWTVLPAMRGKHRYMMMAFCFPDNVTKAKCFEGFPTDSVHSKSWLSRLMPNPQEDAYTFTSNVTFDAEDYMVTKIEQDPKYICQYQDQFVAAMDCMEQYIRVKCPFLPSSATNMYQKFGQGATYICKRIDEIDTVCLHDHWYFMSLCKGEVFMQMKNEFLKASKGNMRRHTRSAPNDTEVSGGGPGGSYKSGKGDHSHSSADNSKGKHYLFCKFKYLMHDCVRQSVSKCHGRTAQIMYEFMQNITSPSCQATMEELEQQNVAFTAAPTDECQGSDCNKDTGMGVQISPLLGLLTVAALLALVFTLN